MLRLQPYGGSKSALESMSATWSDELRGTGITVNVLVPGGPTDTPFIATESGWPRDKMLRPEVMAHPAAWLVSNDSNGITGMRFTASNMNNSRKIAWPELASKAREWQRDVGELARG